MQSFLVGCFIIQQYFFRFDVLTRTLFAFNFKGKKTAVRRFDEAQKTPI